MEEKAIKSAGELVNYGVLGIFCVILLAVVWLALRLHQQNYEKRLKEKDDRITQLSNELKDYRTHVEKRLFDTLDSCADAIAQNSIALHENSAVIKHTEGVLLGIKNRLDHGGG